MKNRKAVEARNSKTIPAGQYKAALKNFMNALGLDDETTFEMVVGPDRVVAKNVEYTRQDNGVLSGDFWNDVVEGKDEDEALL